MNNSRRKEIDKIISDLEEIRSRIETVKDEEQDAFDNMPESLQEGERGEKMQQALDNLDTADGAFDDLMSALEDAKE
jgi:formiminotetrahydrofolate cyclodeaminase